jgi:hypothetical protein
VKIPVVVTKDGSIFILPQFYFSATTISKGDMVYERHPCDTLQGETNSFVQLDYKEDKLPYLSAAEVLSIKMPSKPTDIPWHPNHKPKFEAKVSLTEVEEARVAKNLFRSGTA